MQSRWVRILVHSLVLLLFYGGLYLPSPFRSVQPSSGGAPEIVISTEESRKLAEKTEALVRGGKHQEALEGTLRLHRAYPRNHIYLEQAASIYRSLEQHREEAEYWEKYLEIAPRPIEACPWIARAYEKQGQKKKSIEAFERCLALEPANTDSMFYLAQALERNGELERAADLYIRGGKLAPEYHDHFSGLARLRLLQGRKEDAKKLAAKLLDRDPDNPDALLLLGLAYWRDGDGATARKYLTRGVKVAESYTDFHLALGQIAERDNRVADAVRHYRRARELSPESREANVKLEALSRNP